MSGTLHVCGTPIGNLQDISLRVLDTLREADCIAAEDTRRALKLLTHFGIKKPLISCHEHNWRQRWPEIRRRLEAGENLALVTDAGMPGISDPGQEIVSLCHESQIPVTVAPGPTAVATALTLSGMPSERFVFEGFIPRDNKKREEILKEIGRERRTVVLYESPHHLRRTLEDLLKAKGDVYAAVARELTKAHEEALRGNLSELAEHFEQNEPRGEFVVILAPSSGQAPSLSEDEADMLCSLPVSKHMERYMEAGMDKKSAMKQVAKDRGVSKSAIYSELLDSGDGAC
jgi:16S rRNA (cytidine1402-2'-O)-methyltransferase